MQRVIGSILILYIVALHSSMAGLEVFGACAVVLAIVSSFKYKKVPPLDLFTGLVLGLAALAFLASTVAAAGPRDWNDFGFMRWVFLALAWRVLLPGQLGNLQAWPLVVRVWLGSLIVVSLFAIWQAFTGLDPLHNPVPLGSMWYASGLFSISITFASIAGMSSSMAWGWALAGPKDDRKWALTAAGLGTAATLLTFSRTMAVGIFVIILLGVMLTHPRRGLWALLGLAAAGTVAVTQVEGIHRRLMTLTHLSTDGSTGLRFVLWKSYGAIFQDHPWLGVGLFRSRYLLPEYYARFGFTETFYSHAHSNWIQWLAGAGIFAFLLYLTLSIYMIRLSVRLFRAGENQIFRALGLSTLLAQLLFHMEGTIECNFFDGEVNHFIVFVWAVVLAASVFKASIFRQKISQ